jgi:hypothetical protein
MPETHIGRIGAPSPRAFTPLRHPEWFEGQHEQRLARVLGVTQFGVNHLTLEPGAYSALRHWHEQEDEFVFVLEGELVSTIVASIRSPRACMPPSRPARRTPTTCATAPQAPRACSRSARATAARR